MRLQEFIGLAQEGKRTEALRYARRHLVPAAHDESLLPQSAPGAGCGLFLPLLPPYASDRYYAAGAGSARHCLPLAPAFSFGGPPVSGSAGQQQRHPLTVSLGAPGSSSAAGQLGGVGVTGRERDREREREQHADAAAMELTGLRVRDVLRELSAIGSSGAATTRMLHVAYNRLMGANSGERAVALAAAHQQQAPGETSAREGTPVATAGGGESAGESSSLAAIMGPGLGLSWSRDLVLRLITLVVMDPNTELQPYKVCAYV